MSHNLTNDELRRYSRHLLLPGFGEAGQLALARASVLLVGAGGLGSPLALYLAAAGVGHIGVVDHDVVDETNLQRQILHDTPGVGRLKVDSARERLLALNPLVQVTAYPERFTSSNAVSIASEYDVVADGADNFATRYLVNDLCVLLGKPNVHGSVFRFEGHVSVFDARRGPCYRCLYRQPPPAGSVPDCAEAGVLGVLPGIIGTLQATEIIKILTGLGEPLIGRLLLYDALPARFRELNILKDPACPVCGEHPEITELGDYDAMCGLPVDDQPPPTKQRRIMAIPEITVEEFAAMRAEGEPHLLIDVREEQEYTTGNIGGTLIPLSQLATRLEEIPHDVRVVFQCRSGNRSGRVVAYLQQLGYTNVVNLAGGIRAWAQRIDSSVRV